jgi:hypothetical protein
MSRDPRIAPDAGDAGEAGDDARRDPRSQLLTAYVDGVTELPPDERRGVEAWLADDPAARREADAVHAVLDRLRALPPNAGEVAEPDWAAMERSIRQAVATEPIRPWWRRWQWLVPAMTCATAAAVLLVIWPRPAPVTAPPHRHVPEPVATEPTTPDDVVALWLDGSEVDVDLAATETLGDAGFEIGGAPRDDAADDSDDGDEVALLPATDLVWVDRLDEAALDRAERWLAGPENAGGSTGRRNPAGAASPAGPTGHASPSRKKS